MHIEHNLSTIIPKSLIRVSKAEQLTSTSPECHLVVKGIIPPTQVNLSTMANCYGHLTLVGTIASKSSNIKTGPMAVTTGMLNLMDLYS